MVDVLLLCRELERLGWSWPSANPRRRPLEGGAHQPPESSG